MTWLQRLTAVGRVAAFFGFVLLAQLFLPLLRVVTGEVLIYGITAVGASLFGTTIAMGWFHQRRWQEVGVEWRAGWPMRVFWGIGLGLVAALLVTVIPVLAGLAAFRPDAQYPSSWPGLLLVTVSFIGVAYGEEMYFRGYGLQTLVRAFGQPAAVISLSILFGLAHAANHGATTLSIANTILWGLVLGLAMLKSRDLWFPIGIHFGWNWALPVLGVPVSGFKMGTSGWRLDWSISPMWSGGDYGPEGGLINTLVLPLLALAIWKAPVSRQHLVLLDTPQEEQQ